MNYVKAFTISLVSLFSAFHLHAAQCDFTSSDSTLSTETAKFIKDSVFTLHLQLSNENFNTPAAHQARAKIFDTVFNVPHWSKQFSNPAEFKTFWNWVRFQYWGLLQQQALLREDQGFRTSFDKNLTNNFAKIIKFPVYPHPFLEHDYICSSGERSAYSCNQRTVSVDTLFSPALACSETVDPNSFKFSVLTSQSPMGWTILDIQFKGRRLILDSYNEYENLLNRYGKDRALTYLKMLIHKIPMADPTNKAELSGSVVFNKNYKVSAPRYPLEF